MLIYQFVAVEVFILAFTFSALTRNWLSGFGFVLFLLTTGFGISDFAFLAGAERIYYFVWLPLVSVAASLAGHVFACAVKCPPLIRLNYFRTDVPASESRLDAIPAADLMTALFVVSGWAVAAGINLWLDRTVTGLAPIGTSHETAGIALTICGAVVLLLCSLVLNVLDVRARLALKYLWILCAWPLVLLVADYGYYKYKWDSPLTELVGGALVYFGASVVVIFAAQYLPIRKHTENEEGNLTESSYDPFYRHPGYSRVVFGGIAATNIVGILAFTFAASWPDNSLAVGAITLLGAAGVSLVFSFIIIILLSEEIDNIKAEKVFKTTNSQISLRSGSFFGISDSSSD